MNDQGDECAGPHADDGRLAPEIVEGEGDRRIGAGDEQEDVDMVDAAQHVGDPGRPVARWYSAEFVNRNAEDAMNTAQAIECRPMGQTDEHNASRDGQRGGACVNPTAHGGLLSPMHIEADLALDFPRCAFPRAWRPAPHPWLSFSSPCCRPCDESSRPWHALSYAPDSPSPPMPVHGPRSRLRACVRLAPVSYAVSFLPPILRYRKLRYRSIMTGGTSLHCVYA